MLLFCHYWLIHGGPGISNSVWHDRAGISHPLSCGVTFSFTETGRSGEGSMIYW